MFSMRHAKERFCIDDFFNYPASSGANPLRARSTSVLEMAVLFVAPSTSAYVAVPKVHNEIVEMLLENRADVNSRNYCGQTAFMQACQHGHWEVQTVLLFRSNGTRVDYMSGRTALHFVAMDGHARCIRLLVTDFVPSMPYGETTDSPVEVGESGRKEGGSPVSPSGCKNDQLSLGRFISTAGFTDPNQCSSSIKKSN